MKKLNNKRPLAIAGLTAVCAVLFCMFTNSLTASILALLLLLAAFIFCLLRKNQSARFFLTISVVFILFSTLFFYKEQCVVAPTQALIDQTVSVTGIVYEAPKKKDNSTLIMLENCAINGRETKLKISLYCKSYDPPKIGDVFFAEEAEFFAAAEDGEFYYHTLSGGNWLKAYTRLAVFTGKTETSLVYKIKNLREQISKTLISNMEEENGAIAAALLIGDKSSLSGAFTSKMRIAGASHLFAVSGMHLSIWTGVIFLLLRKRSRIQILPNLISILFVLIYIPLTGFSPSVVRAGLMLILVFFGKIIRKQSDSLNSLGIASLMLLAQNVYLAGNISYLLSFASTWGIITLSSRFSLAGSTGIKKYALAKRTVGWFWNTLFTSLIAIVFTLPVVGFFFGGISLLSPISTIVCTLPVQFVMVSSLSALCYSTIPVLGPALFKVCGFGCETIRFFINKLSALDFCTRPIHLKTLLTWYLVTGVILILLYYLKGKRPKLVLTALLTSAAIMLCVQIADVVRVKNTAFIYVPANGNTTEILFHVNGNGFAAQIGTGQNYSSHEKLRNYYNSNGIATLDALIIPRISTPENGNAARLLPVAKAVYSAKNNEMLTGLNGNVAQSDCFTLKLANTFTYINRAVGTYYGGILESEAVKIVFSFYPGGDFTQADASMKSGDYLICRGGIPKGLDPDRFATVYVLSNKTAKELSLPPGILTTADTGDIIINASASGR